MPYTLVIKNGRIVDGTGAPGYIADVAIDGDRIAAVGQLAEAGDAAVIDAAGKVVCPGFIELHTHYDPQICWDRSATPAAEHGVTTVVIGNCGLSLAPIRPGFGSQLTKMFNKIEDIETRFFDAAVPYSWTSFPEYLDFIRDGLGVNIAPAVGHSVLRHFVMGDAAQERIATDDEVAQMCALLREAIAAGAFGLSMSMPALKDHSDRSMASAFADNRERIALARTLVDCGRHYVQTTLEPVDLETRLKELDAFGEVIRESGACGSFLALLDMPYLVPGQMEAELDKVTELQASGARIFGQTMARPFDFSFRMNKAASVFYMMSIWADIMLRPVPERIKALSDTSIWPALNQAFLDYIPGMDWLGKFTVKEVRDPRNKAYLGRTLREIADTEGTNPTAAMLKIALADELETLFDNTGVMHGDVNRVAALLDHPGVHMGGSDAGAHVAQFAGEGDSTFMLRHFVREHRKFTLERAIQRMTGDLARDFGIPGRGTIEAGNFADLVIFDPDVVDRGPEILVKDLPGGGDRYVRHATGIDKVFVNGKLFVDQGQYTEARAGRTV